MTNNRRLARLTALALATGTLVAAGASSAAAASTGATKDVYKATGGGSVIHLELNLPVALPSVGSKIMQDLVMTGSTVRTSGLTSRAAAVTKSVLGANGNIPAASAALGRSLTAEYGKAQPAPAGAFPANPLIAGGLLSMSSKALNPDADGNIAHSLSSVTDLKVAGAGNLQAVLDALTAQLTTVLTGVVGTMPAGTPASPVSGVTTTVTGLLDGVTAQLNTASQGASQPVKDAVDAVIAQLNALPQALSTQLKSQLADSSLLSIKTIASEQTVSRAAGVVTSAANNELIGVKLLGGLVSVDGMTSKATASLGKNASDASAKGTSTLLHVNVNDLLTAEVTGKLTAVLGGSAVPAQVKDAVNAALAQVTTILSSALGATLTGPQEDPKSKTITANKASDTVSAAHLTVQPTGFAAPLIDLQLVPATAQIVKATQLTPMSVVTPAALPRTGANLPLTGAAAAALIGLAMVARRRRLAHIAQ